MPLEKTFSTKNPSLLLDAVTHSEGTEINTFFNVSQKRQKMFLLIKHLWNICADLITIVFLSMLV